MEEAAELLAKSKTNVRMVVSKLELDLGRQLEIPRPRAGDDGKLLLVRLRKRSPSELTAAGKWYQIAAPAFTKPQIRGPLIDCTGDGKKVRCRMQ